MKLKNIAFTLAETLVVMGIIGVIAALTIPNLSQSTGNMETLARFKKLYANINEAIDRAQAVYGSVDTWYTSGASDADNATRFGDRVTEFMKIQKNLGYLEDYPGYVVVTADGSKYSFSPNGGTTDRVSINFYTNGNKTKSNDAGRKTFLIACEKNSSFFCLSPQQNTDFSTLLSKLKTCVTAASPEWNCSSYGSAWILRFDNMDYLKLKSDGTCPNGTTPTESNPRCN